MTILHRALDAESYLLKLEGALTRRQAEALSTLLKTMAKEGATRVILDLSDVALIDSRGLAALVAAYRLFGSQTDNVRLCALQAQPQLLFELTGFDMIFPIYPSLAEVPLLEEEEGLLLTVDLPAFMLESAVADLAA